MCARAENLVEEFFFTGETRAQKSRRKSLGQPNGGQLTPFGWVHVRVQSTQFDPFGLALSVFWRNVTEEYYSGTVAVRVVPLLGALLISTRPPRRFIRSRIPCSPK